MYKGQNGNGTADPGEGVDGVTVELYRSDQTPGSAVPIFTQTTAGGGRYFFDALAAGEYIVHVPKAMFEPAGPLAGLQSVVGASSSSIDDNTSGNDNGIDSGAPQLEGISSAVVVLAVNDEPKENGGETGTDKDMDAYDDDNFDLTIDFGFTTANPNAVGLGNLVWRDLNGSGGYDAGEGVDGVTVQLFPGAADPLASSPLAQTVTSGGGVYYFANLSEGSYKVFIPASQFAAGKPLAGWTSMPGDGADNQSDDNAFGGGDNGIDGADPASFGVASVAIDLLPGDEPLNSFAETGAFAWYDDFNDDNADLRVDFGFYRSVAVGNVVFKDANFNGIFDAGEGVTEPVPVALPLPIALLFYTHCTSVQKRW